MLCIIVMEALCRIMSIIVDRGLLSSFLVGSRNNDELLVSHLLFADNTLIFCESNSYHLCHLPCLFLCFEAILELNINFSKLELVLGSFGVGVWKNIRDLRWEITLRSCFGMICCVEANP
jgi:hypothetical protein